MGRKSASASGAKEKPPQAWPGGGSSCRRASWRGGAQACARELTLDEEAKACAGDCASLSRHRAAEALTLQSGGEVHFAAAAEQARQKFHDTSPCIVVTRGAFAWSSKEWGISLDGADIGAPAELISGKSEAAGRKNDIV